MSAISALKGYRTQFLYSLHYILSTLSNDFIYRLEGEEDLDVLDNNGQILYAIQLKNLGNTITLSDILSDNKTSFVKRFLENYRSAIPILASYGEISKDLKKWNEHKDSISENEKKVLTKYKITVDEWKLVKTKVQFTEVNEELVAKEVEQLIKVNFPEVDPIPTIGYVLYWLQFIAEKQHPITARDIYNKILDFAKYLSERIAVHNQYGTILKPLHKISIGDINHELLEREFYNATLTRYEHILLGLDITREKHLDRIHKEVQDKNTIILKGASGQGKTALVYSYVHKYINHWHSYEIIVQQDPITTQQSIRAIASISARLEMPVVFVINVTPNTTEWIKIVKEASRFQHIRFLIAIRNEDWYRASGSGIEFEYKEIDLSLSKDEAETVYLKLNEKSKIEHFTDFEQAWIQLGDDAPLLEFVYSITQGDSLLNKLKQQIFQIKLENNQIGNQQIEFLRIVSLADSLGAKIDASKLNTNIDYQFIIEKLENEYLIKYSSDKKYIQGLHIVRSKKLSEILFDEFINYKENYAYKAITLIADEDLYLFLLQLFNLEILKANKFISQLNKSIPGDNWATFVSILKAFIWLGIKRYVDKNQHLFHELKVQFGEGWYVFVNFRFGVNHDMNWFLNTFNVDENTRKKINRINDSLSPKETIFNLTTELLNRLDFPTKPPSTTFEWKSFGESLFWLKNIPNSKDTVKIYNQSIFENAFREMDSKSLSILMLGMYSYSFDLDAIRKNYIDYFIKKVKETFDIIHFDHGSDEISIHYVIDILDNEQLRSSNDFVVNVLDIIRTAMPDKKKFNSQGYGHRLSTLAVDDDSTRKTMAVENMPLEEWVNINACIVNLYDYHDRPADWKEYLLRLNHWENLIKEKIKECNSLLAIYFDGNKGYKSLVPVTYNVLSRIKEPKSITDSLGMFRIRNIATNGDNKREKVNKSLHSKYELFFKSLSDFKGSIDNFVLQFSHTLDSIIKLKTDNDHHHDVDIEYKSQLNLYDAINKLEKYNTQYGNIFDNIDRHHSSQLVVNSLLTTAIIWRDFLKSNKKGDRSLNRLLKLKSDFENRFIKELKQASKSEYFTIKYVNDKRTNGKPIIIVDGESPFWALMGFKVAYNIVHESIDKPESTSLKYLMLRSWFSNFYFIQTIKDKTLNNDWNEIKLYLLTETLFENLTFSNSISNTIEEEIRFKLNIDSWTKLYPEFSEINRATAAYGKLVFLVDHFFDLRLFDEIELSDSDKENLKQHVNKVGLELQESFQIVLDSLFNWINLFPFEEDSYINSEEDQEYFKAMINIRDHIFPEPKGDEIDYELTINMKIISDWVKRLRVCTENWSIFTLLLSGKYIVKYNNSL